MSLPKQAEAKTENCKMSGCAQFTGLTRKRPTGTEMLSVAPLPLFPDNAALRATAVAPPPHTFLLLSS